MISNEQKKIELIEKKKLIKIEENEILRAEKELFAKIKLPADAEAYKVSQSAQCHKNVAMLVADAETQRIKLIAEAEVN